MEVLFGFGLPKVKKGLSKKLLRRWEGPFIIDEMPTPVTVRIRQPGGKQIQQLVHINRLKAYHARFRPTQPPSLDLTDNFDWNFEVKANDTTTASNPDSSMTTSQHSQPAINSSTTIVSSTNEEEFDPIPSV